MPTHADDYMKENPINEEWKEYYILLEGIRASGICNMWGASPYLAELAGIDHKLAQKILCSWINNYDKIKELYWPGNQRVYIPMKDIKED